MGDIFSVSTGNQFKLIVTKLRNNPTVYHIIEYFYWLNYFAVCLYVNIYQET